MPAPRGTPSQRGASGTGRGLTLDGSPSFNWQQGLAFLEISPIMVCLAIGGGSSLKHKETCLSRVFFLPSCYRNSPSKCQQAQGAAGADLWSAGGCRPQPSQWHHSVMAKTATEWRLPSPPPAPGFSVQQPHWEHGVRCIALRWVSSERHTVTGDENCHPDAYPG